MGDAAVVFGRRQKERSFAGGGIGEHRKVGAKPRDDEFKQAA
jgi:hypothetical protein